MTEEEIKRSSCTITFETPDGDKAIINVKPGTELGTLIFEMKMDPPDPEKYQNITGDLINQFLNTVNGGGEPMPMTTGPGGEA